MYGLPHVEQHLVRGLQRGGRDAPLTVLSVQGLGSWVKGVGFVGDASPDLLFFFITLQPSVE